jgi:hypothetical protein
MWVALAVLSPATLGAQPSATSLQQLQRLENGKAVTLTDRNGHEFRGSIADVTESWCCLQIGRVFRCFDAAAVHSIRARKDDSLANGALVGAAVASGLTSLIFLDNECRDDRSCYAALALYGGIGVAAGLIIDAFIHGSVLVYAAPSHSGPVVTLGPMGMNGVRLKIVF